jgi:hypothetical protein
VMAFFEFDHVDIDELLTVLSIEPSVRTSS